MQVNRTIKNSVLAITLVSTGAVVGAQINAERHPHLAAAQKHGQEAYNELTEAQKANDYDAGGHLARAKDLLMQANHEVEMGVAEINKHDRR